MSLSSLCTWKSWSILRKDTETGKYDRMTATFWSRALCEEYISMKKEQHFFNTGSMEEAEKMWGMDNFIIDYSMTIDRASVAKIFNVDFGEWING